eukprot:CAMPEP_0117070600 /NCGR_PEP_ID=MMETSP0472-20121206/49601_1 /TAXON_ID=693140 ORGANISM="Tiarina fusus, Strain LIS" /NCGR_SAMPLE_ID=MMETSP0472 /ASSEMBLY_ACC=CAM_ASM_000603 /LENGTH=694 /DNA_ID=CAMNT_0004793773 /DNA_START=59 /DNA_END=2143 /DNA_ORIENTATION=-
MEDGTSSNTPIVSNGGRGRGENNKRGRGGRSRSGGGRGRGGNRSNTNNNNNNSNGNGNGNGNNGANPGSNNSDNPKKSHHRDASVGDASSAPPPNKRRNNRNRNRRNNKNTTPADGAPATEEVVVMECDTPVPVVETATTTTTTTKTDPSFMTPHTFESLASNMLHPLTKKAIIQDMKLERLTEIQHKTLVASRSSDGAVVQDVLGRARTGTGKTVAFLMPALQTILTSNVNNKGIQILIVSPTRELATQIFNQAKLMTQHHAGVKIQIIMGGTNQKSDVTKFNRGLPTILVATPGRLKDHLQNTKLSNGSSFATAAVSQLQVLILDEADQLLEMGFRPDILLILKYLPPVDRRQTLLFSATVPKELVAVMGAAMKPNYQTVDCIHDDSKDANGNSNNSKETNAHVLQSYAILPPGTDRLVSSVVETILAAIHGEEGFKIIAFFSTARLVGFFSDLFNHGIVKHQSNNNNNNNKQNSISIPNVIEIHSRKSQSARNKASDLFRASTGRSILFTSDVSARGVDYPNVTHVIQFGLPDSREQYIHRLGRTGRAGKPGKGWLVLADFEKPFLRELSKNGASGGGVQMQPEPVLEHMFAAPPSQEALDFLLPVLQNDIGTNKNAMLVKSAELAYQAWLGFYNSNTKRMSGKISKAELVQMANQFAICCGLTHQPALLKKTVGKMGLKGVPGLRTTNAL